MQDSQKQNLSDNCVWVVYITYMRINQQTVNLTKAQVQVTYQRSHGSFKRKLFS